MDRRGFFKRLAAGVGMLSLGAVVPKSAKAEPAKPCMQAWTVGSNTAFNIRYVNWKSLPGGDGTTAEMDGPHRAFGTLADWEADASSRRSGTEECRVSGGVLVTGKNGPLTIHGSDRSVSIRAWPPGCFHNANWRNNAYQI